MAGFDPSVTHPGLVQCVMSDVSRVPAAWLRRAVVHWSFLSGPFRISFSISFLKPSWHYGLKVVSQAETVSP